MNTNDILKKIRPHVVNNQLTYNDFEKIFGDLPRKEQYPIAKVIQEDLDIELVDETIPLPDEKNLSNDNDVVAPILRQSHEIKLSNKILIRLIQDGDEQARQDLCVKNSRLVAKYAVRYKKLFNDKLDIDDLMQEGFAGMLKAAERFDFSKDTEFSTYAVWWICQAISRAVIDTGFTIRLPVHVVSKITRATQLEKTLQTQGVTLRKRIEIIAQELNTSIEDVLELFRLRDKYISLVSLDTPISDEKDQTLVNLIPDEHEPIDNALNFLLLKEQLEEVLSTLTPREKRVLKLRFGLVDGRTRTLEEIGKSLKLTRERIRQIEAKALRKLRQPAKLKKLRDFLE